MARNSPDAEHWSYFLYRMHAMARRTSGQPEARRRRARHRLILAFSGEGTLELEGSSYKVVSSHAYFIPPNASCRMTLGLQRPAELAEIEFSAIGPEGTREMEPKLPVSLPISHMPTCLMLYKELEKEAGKSGRLELRTNLRFQELLLALLEPLEASAEPQPERAVQATVEYMERHYRMNLTRQELAAMAGMSADHYTRTFKKAMGKTPTEFLTDIRLGHAKRALVLTNDSYRSIAQNVGFANEFYFSRKFKKENGVAPSAYAEKWRAERRIVTLQHHLTGHLLALGVAPRGALINGFYPLRRELTGTMAIGEFRPDLDKLVAARPGLILTYELLDEATEPKARMFGKIAPTVTIPFFADWRSQQHEVAKAAGLEREATGWLERYELKASMVRRDLRDRIGEDSVLIVGVGNRRLCLFGRRNVGAVLYEDLGIRAPEAAEGIEHFRLIDKEELFACDADRIVFTGFRNDGSEATREGIQSVLRSLRADPRWSGMKAARNGRIYSLLEEQHLYTLYTSYSHDLLLDRLLALFGDDGIV